MRIFVQIATEITIFLVVPVLSKERMKEFFHFREEGVEVGPLMAPVNLSAWQSVGSAG